MADLTPDEAAARLAALDIGAAMAPTMSRIVFTAERGIKLAAPVQSGRLRRSVHGQVRSATEGVVGTNVIYARYVHRQNPFMVRGADDVQAEIDQILAEAGPDIWGQVTG